jgi:hypothetical protein
MKQIFQLRIDVVRVQRTEFRGYRKDAKRGVAEITRQQPLKKGAPRQRLRRAPHHGQEETICRETGRIWRMRGALRVTWDLRLSRGSDGEDSF